MEELTFGNILIIDDEKDNTEIIKIFWRMLTIQQSLPEVQLKPKLF